MVRKFLVAMLPVGALIATMLLSPASSGAQSMGAFGVGVGPCNLPTAAFCDSMSQAQPNGSRSGDLNGVVWGASRFGGNVSSQGISDLWTGTQLNLCGTTQQTVLPPNDIRICNGQMVEASDDHGGTLGLAAYPKQPFDFAGRVGTVTFDVGNDSQGTHAAWPMFVLTDQPVPVPHPNVVDPTSWNLPNNAVGISFAAGCGSCPGTNFPPSGNTSNCWTADEAWTVTNHQLTTYGVYQNNGFTITGCVVKGSVGHLNHVAVQLSTTSPNIRVFATDPDSTTYREIAEGDNMTLPLTRGLTWLEDDHYNACKENTAGCEQQHTFAWANWGFDGPALPRDLTFDVPDNNKAMGTDQVNGQPDIDIGYLTSNSTLTLQIPNVQSLAQASGALLVFNAQPVNAETVSYSLNGHPAKSFPLSPMTVSNTLAEPVSLSDLVNGNNTLTFSVSDTSHLTAFANIDLVLQGAGGMPAGGSGQPPATSTPVRSTPVPNTPVPSTPTSVPTKMPTPVPSATSTPVSTGNGCSPSQGTGSSSSTLVGSTAMQVGSDCAVPGVAEAFRIVADATGTAGAIHAFLGPNTMANSVILGLYNNSSSNHPGTLMAQTTITNPPHGGWSSAAIRQLTITAGQVYWIVVLQPANVPGTIGFQDTAAGGTASEMSGAGGATILPQTWTPGASANTSPLTAYVAAQ